jgi:hypothetical protein
LGLAVAVLALYTVFFGARPGGRWASADSGIGSAVATEATGGGGKTEAPAGKDKAAATKADAESGTPEAETEVQQPETWGSDPFVRDWLLVNELAEMRLNAITIGGERAYALINDQIMEEGDQISGKRIAKIESDKVILEQGGRTFTLLLGE